MSEIFYIIVKPLNEIHMMLSAKLVTRVSYTKKFCLHCLYSTYCKAALQWPQAGCLQCCRVLIVSETYAPAVTAFVVTGEAS